MTHADPLAELVGVTERLGVVIAAETAALGTSPMPNLDEYVREKTRLSVRYDTLTRQAITVPSELLLRSPSYQPLRDAVERLRRLAAANAKAIEARLSATRRVMAVVARAAGEATEPNFSYGGNRLGYGLRSPGRAAVAVNRML